MARYHSRLRSKRRNQIRRRTYIISISLVIIVIIALIYGYNPFGNKDKIDTDAKDEITSTALGQSAPQTSSESNLFEPAPGVIAEPDPKVTEIIAEAAVYINERPSKIIDARDRLNETLPMAMSAHQRAFVKRQLSELSEKWLFSRTIFPQDKLCDSYKVKPGELLSKIGRQYKVPYEILMEINGIHHPQTLQAGETIKVINGPFHARIHRSTFTMDLYLQNTFVKSFPVGLGQPDMETPTGFWVVKPDGKLISPTWTDPASGKVYEADDPDYPLGSRWIGLKGIKGEAKGRTGFAIHGTKDPNQIGTTGSRGCIRLHNGNAILIYNLLMPGLSQVKVVE